LIQRVFVRPVGYFTLIIPYRYPTRFT